jgi:formylglycine-generating enzyme required for sulfatase activity
MVMIPAGVYTIGRDDESELESPRHTVDLPAFFIDRTEVTNADYGKFVDATSHRPPANWKGRTYPANRANYPVTGVTWQDAADYARWAGKRLPTEAEWEAAARGAEGRRYPWGNDWRASFANIDVKAAKDYKPDEYPDEIKPAGQYPDGASAAGALDLIGNVWEFTADKFSLYPGNPLRVDEIRVGANRQPLKLERGKTYRIIRGGAFDGDREHDASYRGLVDASQPFPKTGFRCAKDAK